MKAVAICCILLLLAPVIVADVGDDAIRALRLGDHQVVGFERMVEEVRAARIIFVGENHEQVTHHKAQMEIIERLYRSGTQLAIGLEMFTAERQEELDRWVAGKLDLNSFIKLYNIDWKMPWPLYQDIFVFARDHRIPMIGLNLPRDISSRVAMEGFAALTADERKRLPAGISCSVDPVYMEFIRKAYAMHARKDRPFVNFCEAQMLWNKHMGHHLQQFLARNPGRAVVVLLGAGHAMKSGIPDAAFRTTGYDYRVILPEMTGLDRRGATSDDADYLLLFDHAVGR